MISLDQEIKKDKQKHGRHRNHNYHRQSRDRSRDHYKSREDRRHYHRERDEERHHDYSRKINYNDNRHHKIQKTIVKISQLHYSVTKEQLKQLCENYGSVKFCKIHWDKMGRSKETAVVGYFDQQNAQLAVKQLSLLQFQGMQVKAELSAPENNDRRNNNHEDDEWGRSNKY